VEILTDLVTMNQKWQSKLSFKVFAILFVMAFITNVTISNYQQTSNTALAATTPKYTVYVSGSTYYATSSTGSVITSSSSFANVMNTINSKLVSGDLVLIQNGLYYVTATIQITKSGVTISGSGSTILQATTCLNSLSVRILELSGSNNILTNIIFDANFNKCISPVVIIAGSYNTVQGCTFKNAIQYCLQAWEALNFNIIGNSFNKAQYAIATGGTSAYYCINGLISGNTIVDARDCGIKLKWAKNIVVTGNIIDTAYLTWTTSGSGSTTTGSVGIRFYMADGPLVGITVSNNQIYDSKKVKQTYGVVVDVDAQKISSSLTITNNKITNCYTGVLSKWINVVIKGNSISSSRNKGVDIWSTATANQIITNTLSADSIAISISSTGCIVSGNIICN